MPKSAIALYGLCHGKCHDNLILKRNYWYLPHANYWLSPSDLLAIEGCAKALRHKGNHIITSQIGHPAVSEVCRFFKNNGFEIGYLMADEFGMVNVAEAVAQQL